jgi:hypothetical protein
VLCVCAASRISSQYGPLCVEVMYGLCVCNMVCVKLPMYRAL